MNGSLEKVQNVKCKIKTKQRITLSLIVALATLVLSLVLAPTARGTFSRYFRTSAPAEPMPNAYQTADNPAGTLELRLMTLAMGDAATASSHAETTPATAGYYKGVIFVSDPLVAENVSAGNWTIHAHAIESSAAMNAYLKFYIYRWTSGDAFGTAIAGPTQHGTELATADAAYELTMSGSAVNFADGDKLVVEVYFNQTANKAGTLTLYWGMTTPSPPTATDDDGWVSGPGSNIPTLSWPLLLIAIVFFIFFMIKKGRLSPSLKPITIILVLILILGSKVALPTRNPILQPTSKSAPVVSITNPNGKQHKLKPIAADSVKPLTIEVGTRGDKR